MEAEAEILSEALCKAAEEIPQKKICAFRKVRNTVILVALAGGAYAAHVSGMSWQKKVGVSAASAAGAIGVISSYVGHHRGR